METSAVLLVLTRQCILKSLGCSRNQVIQRVITALHYL